jgi:type II secretory pathway component PulC
MSSPGPLENPECDAHDFTTPGFMRTDNAAGSIKEDKLVLYLEEVQETMTGSGIEQFFNGNITTEPSGDQNPKNKSDIEKKDAQQEPTKVWTKIKCVESVLKKAVIEPYCINGQIEGLQINGLDKISQAKALHLKSGDIILAVNGQTLSSKKDAYNIFKKARKEPIMLINLLQDGEAKKLLLDFQ